MPSLHPFFCSKPGVFHICVVTYTALSPFYMSCLSQAGSTIVTYCLSSCSCTWVCFANRGLLCSGSLCYSFPAHVVYIIPSWQPIWSLRGVLECGANRAFGDSSNAASGLASLVGRPLSGPLQAVAGRSAVRPLTLVLRLFRETSGTTYSTLVLCFFLTWLFKRLPGKPAWPHSSHWTLFILVPWFSVSDISKDCRRNHCDWRIANFDCDFKRLSWGNRCDHSGHTSAETGGVALLLSRLTEKPLVGYNQFSKAHFIDVALFIHFLFAAISSSPLSQLKKSPKRG